MAPNSVVPMECLRQGLESKTLEEERRLWDCTLHILMHPAARSVANFEHIGAHEVTVLIQYG